MISIEQARSLKDDMSKPYMIRNLAALVVNQDQVVRDVRARLEINEKSLEEARAELAEWLDKLTQGANVTRLWEEAHGYFRS